MAKMILRQWRHRSRGAVSVFTIGLALMLFFLMIASVRLGSMAIQREEHQNQADAISLATSIIAANQGVNAVCNHAVLKKLADGNRRVTDSRLNQILTTCPQLIRDRQPDSTTRFLFDIEASDEVDHSYAALMPLDNEYQHLRSNGRAQMVEFTPDTVELRYPKLVLALDFSGSMQSYFSGSLRKYQSLRKAVNSLLDLHLKADFGSVLYDSNVFAITSISQSDDHNDIRELVNSSTPGSNTNTAAALDMSRQLLMDTEDTGWYVILVSDGLPCCEGNNSSTSISKAKEAARKLREAANESSYTYGNPAGVGLFTLSVAMDAQGRELLKSISGTKDNPGADGYYFEANNDEELQQVFKSIIAGILCSIGPLNPPPPEGSSTDDVHVFLEEANGNEIVLDPVLTSMLATLQDGYAYSYVSDQNKVRLTEAACNKVLKEGAVLRVRYGPLVLAQ